MPPDMPLLSRLAEHARVRPDAIAVRHVGQDGQASDAVSYGRLGSLVSQAAARLRDELPPGAVVIIAYPNRIECIVAYLALLEAGATAFMVSPHLAKPELLSVAKRSAACAIVGIQQATDILKSVGVKVLSLDGTVTDEPPMRAGRSGAVGAEQHRGSMMLLSSGTTSQPKIVHRLGASLDAVAAGVASTTELVPSDHVLALIPLCHSYGVEHGLLAPIWAGCCIHLFDRFDARVVTEQFAKGSITVFPGVPSIYELLARMDDELCAREVRCVYSAGSPLPDAVFKAFLARTGIRIGQLYGSTEVGSVTFNDPEATHHDPTSVGLPMPDVRIRIVDPSTHDLERPSPCGVEGEVAIASPSMLAGYVGEVASPLRDGYFLTGDLGRLDERGRLTITGRIKLLIDVGTFKVNPLEVEHVLCEHEAVRECVVVPLAVTDTIARLRALVVLRPGHGEVSMDALRQFMRARLSAYKVPRVFELRDALPRSAAGKVMRSEITP